MKPPSSFGCSRCSVKTRRRWPSSMAINSATPRRKVPREGKRSSLVKYVDEFRDPRLIKQASEEIRRLTDPSRHYRVMEVCGGHTHAIYRFALADLLPPNIELVHGPGCPVCVLP